MADLPPVPNLDPSAPTPVAAKEPVVSAPAQAVTDPAIRLKRKATAPVAELSAEKRPPTPPPDAQETNTSEVQDSVEEVLQHTSAQTLKLSHLEDVLAALNRTLGDLQDEMHAGFSELRAVIEQSVTNALGARETAIHDKQPASQALDGIEEQLLVVKKSQNLVLIVGAIQALLLAVTLVAVLTSRPSPPMPEPIEPTPAVSPAPSAPLGDPAEPATPANDDSKRRETKKKKARHR